MGGVEVEEAFGGDALGVEAGLPGGIGPAGGSGEEIWGSGGGRGFGGDLGLNCARQANLTERARNPGAKKDRLGKGDWGG